MVHFINNKYRLTEDRWLITIDYDLETRVYYNQGSLTSQTNLRQIAIFNNELTHIECVFRAYTIIYDYKLSDSTNSKN